MIALCILHILVSAHFKFHILPTAAADTKNLYELCGSFAEKSLLKRKLKLERRLIAELNQSLISKEGSAQVNSVKIYSKVVLVSTEHLYSVEIKSRRCFH